MPKQHQAFWRYVIDQETTQVEAFQPSSRGQYRQIAMRLQGFLEHTRIDFLD